MKINPKYGDRIITLPAAQVLESLKDAGADELKVLIFALANQNTTLSDIAEGTGVEPEKVHDALTLWKKRGVMSVTGLGKQTKKADDATSDHRKEETKKEPEKAENGALKSTETNPSRVVLMSSELPVYSTDQINRILEKNKDTKALIDNCQQVLGKIMSVHEVEVILKLIDYLGLDTDFVLLLCIHCASLKKTSLRYVEKTAVALFDQGITEYAALEKYIEHHALAKSREGQLRNLLGIGDRALTKKEKEAFLQWASWEMPMDVIEKAFEITAENTKRFSINYMNTILERWHKSGIMTLEAVKNSLESYKQSKGKSTAAKDKEPVSFVTEDFFEAALRRSYRDADTSSDNKND